MSTTSILNSVLSATTGSSTSAIDVTTAVNDILYADRAPERTWQAEQTTLASQTSAINQLQTESSSLADQLSALQDAGGSLSSITATPANSSVLTASALPGTAVGDHTVVVTKLATTGAWYSASEASSSTALPSNSSFTLTSGGTTTTIQIGSGVDTLDELAASINSQSLGVTANVVTDSTGARLSLVAQSSGSAADFSVSSGSGLSFTQSSTGADASLTVDGVPITSASNTVTGAVNGLTFNLANTGTTTVALTPDTTAITQAVSSFVSAYNTLISDVNSQFAYNSTTQTAGVLSSDSTINGLQSALLSATNYSASSGVFQSLASLGVSTNQDGTLTLNSTTLANAVGSNSSAVATFFEGTASNGFAASLQNALNTYTDPSEGAFTVDLSSISNENQDLTNQTNTLELYLSAQQTALTTKYNNADIALQQLPQELKQINALLNPNSSSSGS